MGAECAHLEVPANIDLQHSLDAVAAAYGACVTAVSLAWLRLQRLFAAPIPSARTVKQLESMVQSFALTRTDDELVRFR
ncbi:aldo/keto reductase [Salinibacterium sp.]|uniref:aldo/keto reductase n=1 Tax=Salinibacterium sp. TaxID=1915057 RepID=UPI00286D1899|nr:aldo/keto reductase [Salinibacterium sp.]